MTYVVKTQDVDDSTRREYATVGGAIKRFEKMLGMSIAECREFKGDCPAPYIYFVRGVSDYGTVVSIETSLGKEAVALAQAVYPPVPTPAERAKALSDEELLRQKRETEDAIAWGESMRDPGAGRVYSDELYEEDKALTAECYARALPGYAPAPFYFPTAKCNPTNSVTPFDDDIPF